MLPVLIIEGMFSPLHLLCVLLPMTIFWVWMLADCLIHEPAQGSDKLIWVIVILLTHVLGAALYFFIRRPQRIRELGH